jgi:hypothetical protein
VSQKNPPVDDPRALAGRSKRDRIARRLSELAKLADKLPPHPIRDEIRDELLRLAGTP